jgi:DNA modification methylase
MRELFLGDNLPYLAKLEAESVDLVFVNPPYSAKRQNNIFGKVACPAQQIASEQEWKWRYGTLQTLEDLKDRHVGVAEELEAIFREQDENKLCVHLISMAARLIHARRTLKPTGSLFVQCHSKNSALLRRVLAKIFGVENVRGEAIWQIKKPVLSSSRYLPDDVSLIVCTKSDQFIWHPNESEFSESQYTQSDDRGQYRYVDLISEQGTAPLGINLPWRDVIPAMHSGHWVPPKNMVANLAPHSYSLLSMIDELNLLEQDNRISIDKTCSPFRAMCKEYRHEAPVSQLQRTIDRLPKKRQKRVETQQEAIIQYLLETYTNPENLVLDPFCGGGGTLVIAEALKRSWIGIDASPNAIHLAHSTLREGFANLKPKIDGYPTTVEGANFLAETDRFEFQEYGCKLIEATMSSTKTRDGGRDGKFSFQDGDRTGKIVVSAKSGHISPALVRELAGVVLSGNTVDIGIFITLNPPTDAMKAAAAKAGFYQAQDGKRYPRVQLLTIAELLQQTNYPRYPGCSEKSVPNDIGIGKKKHPLDIKKFPNILTSKVARVLEDEFVQLRLNL